jgi:hypothetical protein
MMCSRPALTNSCSELLLDRLVLRLGDDQVGHHGFQAAALCTAAGRGAAERLQHAQDTLVIFTQKRQCIHCCCLSRRMVGCAYPAVAG